MSAATASPNSRRSSLATLPGSTARNVGAARPRSSSPLLRFQPEGNRRDARRAPALAERHAAECAAKTTELGISPRLPSRADPGKSGIQKRRLPLRSLLRSLRLPSLGPAYYRVTGCNAETAEVHAEVARRGMPRWWVGGVGGRLGRSRQETVIPGTGPRQAPVILPRAATLPPGYNRVPCLLSPH